ncbi:MAG TPA: uroporphyrinogen decarboxylase family protein, partial [Phycisphaerae bacterium]|nr:uroporphyrinogen decarboxylase family protein [Phycisphaerae bacterium]
MNGYERILAQLDGRPTDCLPFMPITMMFAADRLGVKYGQYTQDHRVLVEAQCRVAEEFDFDYVSAISDPAREAGDCGAAVEFFEDQPPAIIEHQALLADSAKLASLKVPDPCAGGR